MLNSTKYLYKLTHVKCSYAFGIKTKHYNKSMPILIRNVFTFIGYDETPLRPLNVKTSVQKYKLLSS